MRRNRMMDMLMRRDTRMPYDMRRGDMMPRRDRRAMRDRNMNEDYNYEHDYRGYGDNQYSSQRGNTSSSQYDHERGRRDYERGGQYDGGSRYPFMVEGEFARYDAHHYPPYYMQDPRYDYANRGGRRDYNMDYRYDYGNGMLEDEDIEEWSEKLKKEVEDKDKQFFSKENIKKKAMEMGLKFDKFTMEEFMVTALMMYTDYCKTLGTANMEIYLRLAKDWLCDEDVAVKYGEKLATYYDYIVEAED